MTAEARDRFIPARAGNGRRRRRGSWASTVHPRARGERRKSSACARSIGGSSPRARGTAAAPREYWRAGRFIPARAGNGTPTVAPPSQNAVHPRARGERARLRLPRRLASGSSPRARGTGYPVAGYERHDRFIPARAGNGRLVVRAKDTMAVHPRARGERRESTRRIVSIAGSSPRARGTGPARIDGIDEVRFIPARAGNGEHHPSSASDPPVHPRARGERITRPCIASTSSGSSPRARGTAIGNDLDTLRHRFIPARAGNGVLRASSKGLLAVHPRARGERAKPIVHVHPVARFIPARAGNGTSLSGNSRVWAVHPRARGERL